ncbi:MAG TPA: MerR family transcriptional regulator [Patescibacteria group bacterium]|nr:MerR family transcriptional regulator [Patescibacteria group bacterium]
MDHATGYRFYDANQIEKARVIMRLRQMEFSIEDIAKVFAECGDDADILNHLERQKHMLQRRMSEDRDKAMGRYIAASRCVSITMPIIVTRRQTSSRASRLAKESKPKGFSFASCLVPGDWR